MSSWGGVDEEDPVMDYLLTKFPCQVVNSQRRKEDNEGRMKYVSNWLLKNESENGRGCYFESFSISFKINSILACCISNNSFGIHSVGGGSSVS